MVQASELRIGNYVIYHGFENDDERDQPNKIDAEDIYLMDTKPEYAALHSPLPLTIEILLQAGFELKGGFLYAIEYKTHHLSFRHIMRDKAFSDKAKILDQPFFRWDGHVDIYYIHQLQNLYFILSGEELTIDL